MSHNHSIGVRALRSGGVGSTRPQVSGRVLSIYLSIYLSCRQRTNPGARAAIARSRYRVQQLTAREQGRCVGHEAGVLMGTLQGYLAHKKHFPTAGLNLGSYGGPREGAVSYERGPPVTRGFVFPESVDSQRGGLSLPP